MIQSMTSSTWTSDLTQATTTATGLFSKHQKLIKSLSVSIFTTYTDRQIWDTTGLTRSETQALRMQKTMDATCMGVKVLSLEKRDIVGIKC